MPTRHALVTGANRGLGLEFVRQLLARGDHVVATCRHPGRAHALNQLAGEHPGRLHVLPLDVADPRAIAELVRELPLLDPDLRLSLLLNSAGVLHSGERFGSVSAANLEDSFRTNAMGPFLLTQALTAQLVDGATVANVSSMMSSLSGDPDFNAPSYRISKTALNMATLMLARALAPRGITVLALCPGWVLTDMGGSGAEISATESVSALLQVVDSATTDSSGKFLDRFGAAMSW